MWRFLGNLITSILSWRHIIISNIKYRIKRIYKQIVKGIQDLVM